MFFNEENVIPTSHTKVLRANQTRMPDGLMKLVDRLIAAAPNMPSDDLREMVIALVPDFQRDDALQTPIEIDRIPAIRMHGTDRHITTQPSLTGA
jgi:hypothetical protein